MEPNQVTKQAPVQSEPVVPKDSIVQDDNAKKGGKGAIIGMVIFAILALGGIGFGVWTMMDGNTQKDALNNQISDLKKQNNELLDKLENVDINIDVDSDYEKGDGVSTDGYIYVGQWGLKIKIPDDLNVTGYSYSMSSGRTSVGVWGSSNGGQYFPDFANMDKNKSPMGYVSRYLKGENKVMAQLIFSDDQYDYYYSHPQDVFSTEEGEKTWEVSSVGLVEQMLSSESNYSNI